MPWTADGAGEAAATAKGGAIGTLGLAQNAAAREAPAAEEAPAAGELGPVASVAPGVEVPVGGVGLWHTRGR